MAKRSKDSSKGTRRQNGRLSRRALLSSLGTGLVLTSLASGKKALAMTPSPTPTPGTDICALGRDPGGTAVQQLPLSDGVGVDLKKGIFRLSSNKVKDADWLLKCDLSGFEQVIFYPKTGRVEARC